MKKLLTAVILMLPAITWAHPGHGETDGYSITHYFTEPQHVFASVIAMAFAGLVIWMIKSRRKQQA